MRDPFDQQEAALHELTYFESEGTESVRAAGPRIGPMHTGIVPPSPELRKGVPAGAVLSPLAITLRGLRKSPHALSKVAQIVVHMTGSGPASRAKKENYRKPAVEYALDWYLNGGPNGGFPHYVIDFPGTIYATSDERNVAYHAGWVHPGGGNLFRQPNWRAPAWWLNVWGRYGFKSPLDLRPAGAAGPNSRSIGIEMMITTGNQFTDEQYRALARLIVDIERRHGLSIPSAPSPVLLGHEDYAPVLGQGGRAVASGGWDPGAHRAQPFFSWSKVWSYMRSLPAGQTPRPIAPSATPVTGATPGASFPASFSASFYDQVIRKDPRFNSVSRISDLNLLEPVMRQKVLAIVRDAAAKGIQIMVFETYRSKPRQEELFKKGASKLRQVGVHHYGLACDFVKNVNGKPSWDGDFTFLRDLARTHGLIWGGNWGNPNKRPSFYDPGHVQRCSLSRQPSLFNGTWYPDANYDPYA